MTQTLTPFINSPQLDQSTPMCVISDLFDITEADWFNSRLDRSPSRTSSLPESHQNTISYPSAPRLDDQKHHHHQPLDYPIEKNHIEFELLTPDADKSENSFNVLTAQSEDHPFETTLETNFNLQTPLHESNSITLGNDLALEDDMAFGPHDLFNYASLQEQSLTQLTEDTNTRKPPYKEQISLETLTATPVGPEDPFVAPETSTISVEPQSIEQMLQATGQPVKFHNSATKNTEILDKLVPTKTIPVSDELSFDEIYQAISVNGHLLPDVQSYLSALAGTTQLFDSPTYQEPTPKPRKKRKLSKREAARAASAAETAREEELAMLANTKQITDDELLRLKPKKQRRAARFDKPVPSRFCHVCSRTPKNVRLVVCCKIKEGVCRKVICEKCFEEYQWGNFAEALDTDTSEWVCPHCSGQCPERAQCRTYQRINDRLRVNRLKQEGPRSGKKRIRRQTEQRVESGDEKRARFLLPAVAPVEFEAMDDVHGGLSILEHVDNGIEISEGLE